MSSKHFDAYSAYYDLLYADKPYEREADYLMELVRTLAPQANSMLELGCGTGIHALHFAEAGMRVHGIDLSDTMLDVARERLSEHPNLKSPVNFTQGDIRTFSADGRFDCAVAMFDVLSYVNSNEDMLATISTVRDHLNPDGLFLFDFWYGPAVYTQQPHTRARKLENDAFEITRIAEPEFHYRRNVVDVNYTIFVRDKATDVTQTMMETHPMRAFFDGELDQLFDQCNFERVLGQTWFTGEQPSSETWSVLFGYRLRD